jgi:hypothetical protein
MGKKQPVNRGNKRAASGLALPLRDAALASQGYFGSRTRNQPKLERRRATQRHPINQQKNWGNKRPAHCFRPPAGAGDGIRTRCLQHAASENFTTK